MSKLHQRLILIVAIVLCGLTYGLQTWLIKSDAENAPKIDTVSRAMHFSLPETVKQRLVDDQAEYLLLAIVPPEQKTLLRDFHTVMGGLGAIATQVRAVYLPLGLDLRESDWQIMNIPDYPKMTQIVPPSAAISPLLRDLRICWQQHGFCRNGASAKQGSSFLYLIDVHTGAVQYYGDWRWGVLALVQDVQGALGF